MMDGRLGGEPGVREDAEHVEVMALCASREEEGATGRRGGGGEGGRQGSGRE